MTSLADPTEGYTAYSAPQHASGPLTERNVTLAELRKLLRNAGWQERTIELMGKPFGPVRCGALLLHLIK